MTDAEADRFHVSVTFHGGGNITADSLEEAAEKAVASDWTPSGIHSIHVENETTGESVNIDEGELR